MRPTISKYLALGATASAFALLAGACGSGSTSSGGGASSDQVHQMYTWVSTDNDRAQWQSFVDAAKEKDPNFTLTFDGPAFNDYWTKVKTIKELRMTSKLKPPARRSCPACLSLSTLTWKPPVSRPPTTTLR